MTVFVDTSALYSFLDGDDADNVVAKSVMARLLESDRPLTHNYVVVEATALIHRRLGAAAARTLLTDVVGSMRVLWISEDVHRAAESAFLAAVKRRISLVDWVSFELMRRERISRAFAFDRDFVTQGFETLP